MGQYCPRRVSLPLHCYCHTLHWTKNSGEGRCESNRREYLHVSPIRELKTQLWVCCLGTFRKIVPWCPHPLALLMTVFFLWKKTLAFFNTQEGLIKRKTGVLVKHQETAGDIIGLKSYSSKKHLSLAIGNIRVIKCIDVAPIIILGPFRTFTL